MTLAVLEPQESAEYWEGRIRPHLGEAVVSIVAAGREFIAAKAAVAHGEFGRLAELLGMHPFTVERFMAIARHPVLANATHVLGLPPSWGTLYQLSRLDPPVLEAALEAGEIHPAMERKEAEKLVKYYNPPNGRRPPGAKPDSPWGTIQHFDVWSFSKSNGDSSYFGKMPPQVVENLLWFFTEPGDMVVDPFAGGGTTIDVAQEMSRQVWASDLHPTRADIHRHDILAGWPSDAPQKANLILLDPPYWQQAKGKYSDDPADMGNMSLTRFRISWNRLIDICSVHLADRGKVAYIISPTQRDDGTVIDHATEMLRASWTARLKVERRIIVPYQTQQATGQQVEWARENRRMLKLYRDLVVLRR